MYTIIADVWWNSDTCDAKRAAHSIRSQGQVKGFSLGVRVLEETVEVFGCIMSA